MRRVAWLAPMALLEVACLDPGRLAEQREALAQEHRERMERLEQLEARLLGAEALRAEWAELQARHGRVAALACENLEEHAGAMAKHEEREREKGRKLRSRRVAMADEAAKRAPAGTRLGEGGPAD
jgi:DNA repair exonuclease SbcCD ATPase subunit